MKIYAYLQIKIVPFYATCNYYVSFLRNLILISWKRREVSRQITITRCFQSRSMKKKIINSTVMTKKRKDTKEEICIKLITRYFWTPEHQVSIKLRKKISIK